jgi:hypothetical protein
VSAPDRVALEAAQTAWAAGMQAPLAPPEDTRTHQDEIMASHPGRPTQAEAIDRGVTPSTSDGFGFAYPGGP